MEWAVRAVGAFYVIVGGLGLWQAACNWRQERAIAGLWTPLRNDRTADVILLIGAFLVLLSGLALTLLLVEAVVAFLLCWVLQAVYLLWAQQWRPPQDPIALRGRRQTMHAFAAYSAVTLVVLWLPEIRVLA